MLSVSHIRYPKVVREIPLHKGRNVMRYEFPDSLSNDFEGYSVLLNFHEKTRNLFLDEVILDFKRTSWFEANLCAVLGAVLNSVENDLNIVRIENLIPKIERLFRRNYFLGHFGDMKIRDLYKTAVKYRKFRVNEEKLFKNYLDFELLAKAVMPDMSNLLRKKINESIFEIFNNAVIHGDCQNIFSCGQYFPTKKRLDFTIVDIGVSIKQRVDEFLRQNLSGEEAIQWAVTKGHTTRTGNIPGGLGFSLIREFLEKNDGKIQIISGNGFWEQTGKNAKSSRYPYDFPGTIVNLEFNIDDKCHYYLLSEIKEEDIF